jgi:hypothetical protein
MKLYSKNNCSKKASSMPQVVEHLPSKYKALSTNTRIKKKKKKKSGRDEARVD